MNTDSNGPQPTADHEVQLKIAPGGGARIPTEDPLAALLFCQNLAAFLEHLDKVEESDVASDVTAAIVGDHEPGREKIDISIVIPVFNESENISVLHERILVTLADLDLEYEIIFVDDGSRDNSVMMMDSMAENDDRIVVVELARNFGHQIAISAGMDYSRGDAVVVMDADLQDPPELLPAFIDKWREGYDVVYAVREHRKEQLFKRIGYAAFYRLLRWITKIDIPLDAGDFSLMDRRVVDLLNNMPERNRFVRGIRSWVGLKQTGITYERQARYAGETKYTYSRLFYLALDGLVSFSYLPLRIITMLGFLVSLITIVLAVFYAIRRLTVGLNPPGFATIVVAIFFLAGLQLVTRGVIGEYVGRIFEEVKQRPLYVIRRVLRH